MKWTLTVAKIAGTRVQIHLTFLILLAWIAVEHGANGGLGAAIDGIVFVLLVFACVTLHEFGHAVVALRYGITTPTITLYPIGGLARMGRIPSKPIQELAVAIAGPVVNFAIAAILVAVNRGMPDWNVAFAFPGECTLIQKLIWINLILACFNLIPAFPMDGGRIFRALLSYVLSREKATEVAGTTGQILAMGFAFSALILHAPLLLLISLFVMVSAGSEKVLVRTEQMLEEAVAADLALTDFRTLQMEDTIHHAVDLILETSQIDFPVINKAGQCMAIATRDGIIRKLREAGPDGVVAEVVDCIPAQIPADIPALEAWQMLRESKLPAAAVVDDHGKLERWLTSENISEFILSRSAMHDYVRR